MGRATRRPRPIWTAAAAIVAAGSFAAGSWPAGASAAGWTRPFRLAGPLSLDVLPVQLSLSPGNAAAAFGVENEDSAASSSAALIAVRPRTGPAGLTRRVPGAREILDLTYAGPTLDLLTGAGPNGVLCCSSAQLVRFTNGALGRPLTLVRGLTSAPLGRLVALPDGVVVASVATARGVWVTRSARAGRFLTAHRLTRGTVKPQTLAATGVGRGTTVVAWTAATPTTPPRAIYLARGTGGRLPGAAGPAVAVPAGHEIDELSVAPGRSAATAAWIESWYDAQGHYQSEAVVADLGRRPVGDPFEIPAEPASGVTVAGNGRGDEVLVWKTCDAADACSVRAVIRSIGHRFGEPVILGPIDASQTPAAAVGPAGGALVGWIDGGRVLAASHRRGTAGFAQPHAISRTSVAADLTLAFGPTGEALAAWTQGTATPSVIGATYRSR